MLDAYSHRREAGRVAEICRTAGAEGRFFPIVGADAITRRLFEQAISQAGRIDLELHKVSVENPVPEALASHKGDHYNRLLWCIDGVGGAVGAAGEDWFDRLDKARETFLKPGTWVLLWLPDAGSRALLAARAPGAFAARTLAQTLFTPPLTTEGSGGTESAEALTNQAEEAVRSGDAYRAMSVYSQALVGTPSHAAARVGLANLVLRMGDVDAAAALYEQAEAHALEAGSATPEVLGAVRGLAELERRRGNDAARQGHWKRARAVPETASSPAERARSLGLLGDLELEEVGNPGLAGPCYEAALAAAREGGERRLLATCILARAAFLRRQGDPRAAISLLDAEQEAAARPLEALCERGRAHMLDAVRQDAAGEASGAEAAVGEATDAFAEAFNLARTTGDLAGQADVAMDLADLNFRVGRLEAAMSSLDTALRLSTEAGRLPVAFEVRKARRIASVAVGNHAEALGDLRGMEDLARAMGYPDLDGEVMETRGDHNAGLRIEGVAAGWWDQAAELYDELGLGSQAAACRAKRDGLNR
jgi:tetratricopeptide (TPR) repeat protein